MRVLVLRKHFHNNMVSGEVLAAVAGFKSEYDLGIRWQQETKIVSRWNLPALPPNSMHLCSEPMDPGNAEGNNASIRFDGDRESSDIAMYDDVPPEIGYGELALGTRALQDTGWYSHSINPHMQLGICFSLAIARALNTDWRIW